MYSSTAVTLALQDGGTLPLPAATWVNISLHRGARLFAQGVSDAAPVTVLVRACDELVALAGAIGASQVGTWNVNASESGVWNMGINAIAAALSQSNQLPVSNAGPQGVISISGSLTAAQDNSLTFASVVRRILIQNISASTQYGIAFDQTASAGTIQIPAPAANAISMIVMSQQCSVLHVFVPTGGNTGLNAAGGIVVMAWS